MFDYVLDTLGGKETEKQMTILKKRRTDSFVEKECLI